MDDTCFNFEFRLTSKSIKWQWQGILILDTEQRPWCRTGWLAYLGPNWVRSSATGTNPGIFQVPGFVPVGDNLNHLWAKYGHLEHRGCQISPMDATYRCVTITILATQRMDNFSNIETREKRHWSEKIEWARPDRERIKVHKFHSISE